MVVTAPCSWPALAKYLVKHFVTALCTWPVLAKHLAKALARHFVTALHTWPALAKHLAKALAKHFVTALHAWPALAKHLVKALAKHFVTALHTFISFLLIVIMITCSATMMIEPNTGRSTMITIYMVIIIAEQVADASATCSAIIMIRQELHCIAAWLCIAVPQYHGRCANMISNMMYQTS
jgi:hypothetical protein